MGRKIDCMGRTFSFWTVTSNANPNPKGLAMWNCVCRCGLEKAIAGYLLASGRTKSCGCEKGGFIRASAVTHGKTNTSEFKTWVSIKNRCNNSNSKDFKNYGGRGIAVCNRWIDSFENFVADMGIRPDGMSIERIDNDKGYSIENCRWATTKDQNRNKRNVVFFGGKCQSDWAAELGITVQAVAYLCE